MHVLGLLSFTHLVSSAGYSAIFVLCVLQSCCVPTSSELTLGFAGVLAAQGRLSLAAVVAVGVLGELVGAYVAWVVGRYAGRAVVDRFGRYVLLSQRDLDRAEAWYCRHGRFGVFGSRLFPVIRNFVALPAGIAEVPLVRFGVLTAAGSLMWDGAWAGIGYGVGTHWHALAKGVGDAGYLLAALAAVVIAIGAHHRYRSYKVGSTPAHAPSAPRRPQHARLLLPGARTAGVRWIASSSGQPPMTRRRNDLPGSPIAAWEAAVVRGRREPAAPADDLFDDGAGVEANGRLTAMLGALLLVLLAAEGVTILRIGSLATLHVVIGMVLVPVVVLKIGSTT
ncbi:MAG: DedA family protein, partial [Trebonia sp.]